MTTENSANDPPALVDSAALNREIVALCTRFSNELFAWMDKAVAAQAAERRVSVKIAVSEVACALTDRLLYPAYLHHPELIPADL